MIGRNEFLYAILLVILKLLSVTKPSYNLLLLFFQSKKSGLFGAVFSISLLTISILGKVVVK